MKKIQLILLVALMLCFVTKNFSQNYKIANGFGLNGGITKFDIVTDNFVTSQGDGFLGGLSATVDFPHKWYNMSYGMQLSENPINILGRPTISSTEDEFVEYKMFTAQLAFLGHIKIIPYHFTIDIGPIIQYNGRLEIKDKAQEDYYINNYTNLSAEDIVNVSQFNVNGAIGVSGGIRNFKLRAQYIYGLTNILKNLDNEDLDTTGGDSSFKGNQTLLVLGAIVSF